MTETPTDPYARERLPRRKPKKLLPGNDPRLPEWISHHSKPD